MEIVRIPKERIAVIVGKEGSTKKMLEEIRYKEDFFARIETANDRLEVENMYTLYSIDAWKEPEGGWTYNIMYEIEKNIYLDSELSSRALLKFMRRCGWLTEFSKGKVEVNNTEYDIEILNHSNKKPLFCFRPQWPM